MEYLADKEREAFEVWASKTYGVMYENKQGYPETANIKLMWAAWQAAKADQSGDVKRLVEAARYILTIGWNINQQIRLAEALAPFTPKEKESL